jgi:hypothetical protein
VTKRPVDALYWSNISTWIKFSSAYNSLPRDYANVLIPSPYYLVLDVPHVKLTALTIEGILEIDNKNDCIIEAEMIFINGGQMIVGFEDDPMLKNVNIILNGKKDLINFTLPNGLEKIGGKGIGVYGGLDMHGKPRNVSWTQLNSTAFAGSNTIILEKSVDWEVNEQIVITTTSYKPEQTEIFTIAAISSDRKTIRLNSSLLYDHVVVSDYLPNGVSYRIAAAVGLLTRNIKVIGAEYDNQFSDLYGNLSENIK